MRRRRLERRYPLGQRAGTAAPPAEPDPALWRAVASLPPRSRTAVTLGYVADLPEGQIVDRVCHDDPAANLPARFTSLPVQKPLTRSLRRWEVTYQRSDGRIVDLWVSDGDGRVPPGGAEGPPGAGARPARRPRIRS